MVSEADKHKAEELKVIGNLLFSKGKFQAAAEKYTECLTMWPDWTVPMLNRATCYKKKGNWVKVEEDCRKALSLNGTLMKAHYFLGLALEEQGDLDQSVSHLKKALEGAHESADKIKDEIWRVLARVNYSRWEQKSQEREAEHEWLKARLSDMMKDAHKKELDNPVDYVNARARHTEDWAALNRLFDLVNLSEKPKDCCDTFTCPLTMEVFRDPASTPSGFSYEHSALLDHLSKVGNFDPITRKPMTASEIVPNVILRNATQDYLDEHPWAWKECT